MAEETKQLNNKIWNLVVIFAGMGILAVHLLLYSFSKDVFNIIISLYIIAFTILFLIFLQKKKKYTTETEYNFLTYTCMFVLLLELMILGVSGYSLFNSSKKRVPNSSNTFVSYYK